MKYATLQDKHAAHDRRKFRGLVRSAVRILCDKDQAAGCHWQMIDISRRFYEAEMPKFVQAAIDSGARRIDVPRMAAAAYCGD